MLELDTSFSQVADVKKGGQMVEVGIALLKQQQDIAKDTVTQLLNTIPPGQSIDTTAPPGKQVNMKA